MVYCFAVLFCIWHCRSGYLLNEINAVVVVLVLPVGQLNCIIFAVSFFAK